MCRQCICAGKDYIWGTGERSVGSPEGHLGTWSRHVRHLFRPDATRSCLLFPVQVFLAAAQFGGVLLRAAHGFPCPEPGQPRGEVSELHSAGH